jgi:2-keto-4-pentenoate hydratase
MDALIDIQAVAAEAFATLDTGGQIEPFSSRLSSFNLDDAYRVTAAVRKMRETGGELPVGRKIGFTNRTIWAEYNVYEPVWGMFTIARCITSWRSAITFPLVGLALGLSETGF